jgi:hypothetical protein
MRGVRRGTSRRLLSGVLSHENTHGVSHIGSGCYERDAYLAAPDWQTFELKSFLARQYCTLALSDPTSFLFACPLNANAAGIYGFFAGIVSTEPPRSELK